MEPSAALMQAKQNPLSTAGRPRRVCKTHGDYDMKIKPQYGFELGISEGGYLRISQETPGFDDQIIILSANEVRLLIDKLNEFSDGDWWSSFDDGDSDE